MPVTEAVVQRCSVKKVFLEISQSLQENTCARISFLIKLKPATLLKTRLWYRCFPVNFVKLSRTLFLQNTSGRLLLFPQHSHSQHSLSCILSWFYSLRTLVETNINGLNNSIRSLSEVLLFCFAILPCLQ